MWLKSTASLWHCIVILELQMWFYWFFVLSLARCSEWFWFVVFHSQNFNASNWYRYQYWIPQKVNKYVSMEILVLTKSPRQKKIFRNLRMRITVLFDIIDSNEISSNSPSNWTKFEWLISTSIYSNIQIGNWAIVSLRYKTLNFTLVRREKREFGVHE